MQLFDRVCVALLMRRAFESSSTHHKMIYKLSSYIYMATAFFYVKKNKNINIFYLSDN